jgi:hypothetical protein
MWLRKRARDRSENTRLYGKAKMAGIEADSSVADCVSRGQAPKYFF